MSDSITSLNVVMTMNPETGRGAAVASVSSYTLRSAHATVLTQDEVDWLVDWMEAVMRRETGEEIAVRDAG